MMCGIIVMSLFSLMLTWSIRILSLWLIIDLYWWCSRSKDFWGDQWYGVVVIHVLITECCVTTWLLLSVAVSQFPLEHYWLYWSVVGGRWVRTDWCVWVVWSHASRVHWLLVYRIIRSSLWTWWWLRPHIWASELMFSSLQVECVVIGAWSRRAPAEIPSFHFTGKHLVHVLCNISLIMNDILCFFFRACVRVAIGILRRKWFSSVFEYQCVNVCCRLYWFLLIHILRFLCQLLSARYFWYVHQHIYLKSIIAFWLQMYTINIFESINT